MKEVNCHLCGSAERRPLFKQTGRDPFMEALFGSGVDLDLY